MTEVSQTSSRCVEKAVDPDRSFVARRIGDQTLIVPVCGSVGDLNAIYTLNELGSRIWELIDGPIPVSQIVDIVGYEYDISAEEAARDIVEFLNVLESKALIRSSAGTDS